MHAPIASSLMVTFDHDFDLRALRRDYGDVCGEATACRSAAALFDFSFMHRIRIQGPRAGALIAQLTPRKMDELPPRRIRYALALDGRGHVRGDLTVWRMDNESFELFLPPSDAYVQLRVAACTTAVSDLTEETAVLAVQGPASLRALAALAPAAELRALGYFEHAPMSVAGVPCRVGRLGYTGERGFEIILPRASREVVWDALAMYARPAGFAAADILRIEAGFPLFTNEFRFPVTSQELGLARFAGNDAAARTAQGAVRLMCFQAYCDQNPVLRHPAADAQFPPGAGTLLVTSACRSITADAVIGLGYAASDATDLVHSNGEFRNIRKASLPIYDPEKIRPRGGWRADLWPMPA
jgi:aminomethyltransferase